MLQGLVGNYSPNTTSPACSDILANCWPQWGPQPLCRALQGLGADGRSEYPPTLGLVFRVGLDWTSQPRTGGKGRASSRGPQVQADRGREPAWSVQTVPAGKWRSGILQVQAAAEAMSAWTVLWASAATGSCDLTRRISSSRMQFPVAHGLRQERMWGVRTRGVCRLRPACLPGRDPQSGLSGI